MPSPSPPTPGNIPLLTIPEDLIASKPHLSPRIISLSFSGLLNPPLQLLEDRTEVGSQLWPAGMALAEYLLRCKMDELQGKTIVELGAGSGLVGLALALHSPSLTIHLTDLPHLLPTLTSNLVLNAPRSSVHPSVLSWGEIPVPSLLPPNPDVLLAADCVYFEPAFPLLLQTMQTLIGKGTVCYFCFVKRRRADLGFLKKLRKAFDVREVAVGWEVEGDADGDVNLSGEKNIEGGGDNALEVTTRRRKHRIFLLEVYQKPPKILK